MRTVPIENVGRRFRPLRRLLASFVLVALLAGCAGAQVTGVTATQVAAPQPAAIAVAVDIAPDLDAAQTETAQHVARELQGQLVQRLQKAGLAVVPVAAGMRPPGAALLHVSIVQADSGNRLERFVIGFGAGRASLQARADFEGAGPAPMTAFDTASDTGRKPGLILPGGIALATRNLVHLAIGGGIGVALNLRDGMDQPAKDTAAAIVKQVRTYYESVGWRWPADARA